MNEVVSTVALSICSPFIVIGMLVMETILATQQAVARRKVHPVGMADSHLQGR
jgi:hypothetical protein